MARKKSDSPTVRAKHVLSLLKVAYPSARTELIHRTPFELLIATILSAQCTDERVNIVTRTLFTTYRSPDDFAKANQAELEKDIHSTGFFRMKARSIINCSRAIVECHHGSVPSSMEELVRLPGVGRKTANVVLTEAFGKNEGIVVDTHVHRVSQRLGLTAADEPEKIEQDLMSLFDQNEWGAVGTILILHGRRICNARKPKCSECAVATLCPSAKAFIEKPAEARGKKQDARKVKQQSRVSGFGTRD